MTNANTNRLTDVKAVASEALAALDTGGRIAPFSARLSTFDLDDAYRVTAEIRQMREMRGEMPVGRKIGFTNRTVWAEYAPIWGYVYDRTVHNLAEIGDTFSLVGLAEPRIKPEIVFKLARASFRHGRDSIAGLPRLGRAWFRNRAVNLSWMEVFRARRGRGVRPARCPVNWASSFNRCARRGLAPDAFDVRNRSEARRHGRRSRSGYECVGRTFFGATSSRRHSRARYGQSATRDRRDRHNGNADACTSGISRRDMDNRTQ